MTWNDIREEVAARAPKGKESSFDLVRREKIVAAESISGVPLIIYATDFTDETKAAQYGAGTQIDLGDKTGFLQALSDITGNDSLDVLIHSPGGSPTAAESIVKLLRSKFKFVRFIVPHTAKSAATMLALSGNEILLGEAAELGPIDPQLQIANDQRVVTVPAGAAIDQFRRIHDEVAKDPNSMRKWLPIIRQYGPAFLQECYNAIHLSEALVGDWLEQYMLYGTEGAERRAKAIANQLANHNNFKSHSRPIWMDQLRDMGIKVKALREVSEEFESAIMDVYWAIDVTFGGTPAFKIIEHSSTDAAYIRLGGIVEVPANKPAQQGLNRQQRRQQARKKG